MSEEPYGTVLYHRTQTKAWRMKALIAGIISALGLTSLVMTGDQLISRILMGVLVLTGGVMVGMATAIAGHHRQEAWLRELYEVGQAMAQSDLYTADDFAEAAASNPPPGMKPAEWRRQIAELQQRYREQHEE